MKVRDTKFRQLSQEKVAWLPADASKGHFFPNWCRGEWEVLETLIGQMEEPFQVTLLYTSCPGDHMTTVALDSLGLIDCDSGEFIVLC